jgi:hypothetical protein
VFTVRPLEERDGYVRYLSKSSSAVFASIQMLTETVTGYCRSVQGVKSVDRKSFDGAPVDESIQPASSAEGMLRSIEDKSFDGAPVDKSAKSSFSAKVMFRSLLDCCFKAYGNKYKASAVSPPPPLSPPVKIGFPADDLLAFARKIANKQLFKDSAELYEYQDSYDAYVASSKGKDGVACYEAYIESISKLPGVVRPSPAKGRPDSADGAVPVQQDVNLHRNIECEPGAQSAFTRVSSGGLFKHKGQSPLAASTSDVAVIGVSPDKDRPGSVASMSSTDTVALTVSSGSRPSTPTV